MPTENVIVVTGDHVSGDHLYGFPGRDQFKQLGDSLRGHDVGFAAANASQFA